MFSAAVIFNVGHNVLPEEHPEGKKSGPNNIKIESGKIVV